MNKGRLFLIHWNQLETESYANALRALGWQVDTESTDGARGGHAIKQNPPDAVVIYHTRLPAHGRATAQFIAEAKTTRHIPIIFVSGEGQSLEKTKTAIPAAIYIAKNQLPEILEALQIQA